MSEGQPYILCADDDPINLELVDAYLEGLYEVKCVENGQQCLDSVEERMPDLILLDLMMPIMDGKTCCKALKSSPTTKDIPIIILSAKSYEEDKKEMFKMGVNNYLTKPFSEERLIKVIGDCLSI